MRSDFHKVVTERPRAGGGLKDPKGYKKENIPCEDAPSREKIRQKWQSGWVGKEFTDLIGPLARYISSQCGRKWDDVYSEISQTLPKTSKQTIHIHGHIFDFVETKVEMKNGIPYHKEGSMTGFPIEGNRYSGFYVHPKTGILTKSPASNRWRNKTKENPYRIKVDKTHFYLKLNNVWYSVEVKPFIPQKYNQLDVRFKAYEIDAATRQTFLNKNDAFSVYGESVIGINKKQMNTKELKKANLK